MKRILFLDVDGVLTSNRCYWAFDKGIKPLWDTWDPVALAVLHKVCETGVRLVISSTWRLHKEELDVKLNQHGLMQYLEMPDWCTPHLPDAKIQRGTEIKTYLDAHPEIKSYRILDDDVDILEDQQKKFIQTDSMNGMQDEAILKLLRWCQIKEEM